MISVQPFLGASTARAGWIEIDFPLRAVWRTGFLLNRLIEWTVGGGLLSYKRWLTRGETVILLQGPFFVHSLVDVLDLADISPELLQRSISIACQCSLQGWRGVETVIQALNDIYF
jgi:hypothetical protein